jgi:murein DD-endopeptidase MepM/ murein hydrolase activator NlpD
VRRQAPGARPDRPRATVTRVNRFTVRIARSVRSHLRRPAIGSDAGRAAVHEVRQRFTHPDRVLPITVATIVAVASLLAVLPGTPQGAVGGTQGRGAEVRISVGGSDRAATNEIAAPATGGPDIEDDTLNGAQLAALGARVEADFRPVTLPEVRTKAGAQLTVADADLILDDGTLLTGYAPETTVEDGADLIRTYRVRKGDTLVTIAHKFDVSMMTLWWANKLKNKDDLHIGQVLRIPPVSGLVYQVKDTDTLESVAKKNDVAANRIVELNGLEDPTLVVGQVLVLPGAKGAPIPTPKPTAKPAGRSSSGPSRSTRVHGPSRYTGGSMRWPVIGGNNYVSQGFHYGHYGLDIAADAGARVVAAAGGVVTFAGWKSNGGGYQVWISHGSGLYTTYNHMSGVSVGRGQHVGRGQQVGRVGSSGWATGPHLHLEVWRGPIWNGGTRVNPRNYL